MGFKNLFLHGEFSSILNDYPITFYDIGTRGEFDTDLEPIAFGVDAVGFEPDPDEYSRLNLGPRGPWRSAKFFPHAIGDFAGRRILHVPSEPEGASLLPPKQELPPRLFKEQYLRIEKMITVDTVTLQDAADKIGGNLPDCLKIDIEGPELAVLRTSPAILDNLLTVKMEVMYPELRQGQSVACEIEAFMSENGFILMDMINPTHWRTLGYVIHPHISDEIIPYSRGQLIQGDYLFFRNYDGVAGEGGNADRPLSEIRFMKLMILSMAYGYFDYAADMLRHEQGLLMSNGRDMNKMFKSLSECSRRYGRVAMRREFFRHLRLLGPYIRRARNLVLP